MKPKVKNSIYVALEEQDDSSKSFYYSGIVRNVTDTNYSVKFDDNDLETINLNDSSQKWFQRILPDPIKNKQFCPKDHTIEIEHVLPEYVARQCRLLPEKYDEYTEKGVPPTSLEPSWGKANSIKGNGVMIEKTDNTGIQVEKNQICGLLMCMLWGKMLE